MMNILSSVACLVLDITAYVQLSFVCDGKEI